jgi:hypothetical protein
MTEWSSIPRISRTIPFGYQADENDDKVLLPVVFELEALEKARQHLKKGYSLRDVADWLSEVTGRNITFQGLKKRLDNERTRQRKVAALKHWTKRYEEAIETIKEIEARPGARATDESGGAQLEFDFDQE